MSARKPLIALDLDHDHLTAVSATVTGERVTVRLWLMEDRPESVDAKDAQAVGRWIGSVLSEHDFARGRVIVSVPRGDVVLKRMSLPAVEESDAVERAGMVRLQMIRQLTMPAEGASIDFVPISAEDETGEEGSLVLAGAMPGDRLEWVREMVKSARLRLDRVALRSAGTAVLLAGDSQRRGGPILGVTMGWATVEFVIVEDGQLVFVRAADIARPMQAEEVQEYSRRVAVEAKRTWMSYRVSRESAEVEAVAVLETGELAELVGQRCGEAIELPWQAVGIPDADGVIVVPEKMPHESKAVGAPLVGLLAESIVGREGLDFAHPRKAPDLGAAARQRVLLAIFLLIVIAGVSYFIGTSRLNKVNRELASANQQVKSLEGLYGEYLLDQARVEHLDQWMNLGVDWLAHLRWLVEQMPEPSEALILEFRGTLKSAEVRFVPKGGKYTGGQWEPLQLAQFDFGGRMAEREVADALRGRLIDADIYTVENKGPDEEHRFDFMLQTARRSPFVSTTGEAIVPPVAPGAGDAKAEPAKGGSTEGGGS